MSEMWGINSALKPPTGTPAALEGSCAYTARGTLFENLLEKMEAGSTGFQEQELQPGPMGLGGKGRNVFETGDWTVHKPLLILNSLW